MDHYLAPALGFVVTLLLAIGLSPLAGKIGLVDKPCSRKRHEGNVPVIGGIAIVAGFSFAILTLPFGLNPYRALFASALLMVIMGALDDFHDLSARLRLLGQVLVGLLITLWGGTVLVDVGFLLTREQVLLLGLWAVPITVFGLVGAINALNFIDGLDGLAGSLSLVAIAGMSWVAWQGGEERILLILLSAAACVLAFLLLNMRFPWQRRARVFMGDAGSMFLGLFIAWFLVTLSQGPDRLMTPVTALFLFAVPLMDTVFVILRRIFSGRSPFKPDRMHLHHLFLGYGLRISASVFVIVLFAVSMASAGLLAREMSVPEYFQFAGFVSMFAIYTVVCSCAWRRLEKKAEHQVKQDPHHGVELAPARMLRSARVERLRSRSEQDAD